MAARAAEREVAIGDRCRICVKSEKMATKGLDVGLPERFNTGFARSMDNIINIIARMTALGPALNDMSLLEKAPGCSVADSTGSQKDVLKLGPNQTLAVATSCHN